MFSLKAVSICSSRLLIGTAVTASNGCSLAQIPSQAITTTCQNQQATSEHEPSEHDGLTKQEPFKNISNSWLLFCQDRISEFTKVPKRKACHSVKEISREYHDMDKTELRKRFETIRDDLKREKLERCEYFDSLKEFIEIMASRKGKSHKELLESDFQLPERPKQPTCPWILFYRSKTSGFTEFKNKRVASVVKELSEEYRAMDKTDLLKSFRDELMEYQRKRREYLNALTPAQEQLLSVVRKINREKNAHRKLSSLKLPKRPRTPNSFYIEKCLEDPKYEELIELAPLPDVFKRIHRDFLSLSEPEREQYNQLAEQDRKRFKLKFEKWYAKKMCDPELDDNLRTQVEELREKIVRTGHI